MIVYNTQCMNSSQWLLVIFLVSSTSMRHKYPYKYEKERKSYIVTKCHIVNVGGFGGCADVTVVVVRLVAMVVLFEESWWEVGFVLKVSLVVVVFFWYAVVAVKRNRKGSGGAINKELDSMVSVCSTWPFQMWQVLWWMWPPLQWPSSLTP